MRTDRTGPVLTLGGKQIAKLRGTKRMATRTGGKPVRLIGAGPRAVTVPVQTGGRERSHNFKPDSEIAL